MEKPVGANSTYTKQSTASNLPEFKNGRDVRNKTNTVSRHKFSCIGANKATTNTSRIGRPKDHIGIEQQKNKKKMRVLVLITLFLILRPPAMATNIENGQNAYAFQALCKLTRLTNSELTLPAEKDTKTADYWNILKLNMSVASSEWKQVFRTADKPPAWQEKLPDESKRGPDWPLLWPDWLKAIQAIEKPNGGKTDDKSTYSPKTEEEKATIASKIIPIAAEAHMIANSVQIPNPPSPHLNAETIKQRLAKMLTGQDAVNTATASDASHFGASTSGGRDGACTTKAGTPSPQTVGAFLACVCLGETQGTVDYACDGQQTKTEVWANGGSVTASRIGTLIKMCGKDQPHILTAREITEAIEAFKQAVRIKASDGYLGVTKSSCSGEQSTGRCVKLTGYTDRDKGLPRHVQWLADLQALAEALQQREQRIEAAAQAEKHLKALATHAAAITDGVKRLPSARTRAQGQLTPSKPHTAEDQNKCKNPPNKTAAGCASVNCNYDDKEKECKPKPGTETAATGTGDTGTAVSTGCEML
uniref:Variant surface glycoprotein 1125.1008 n=1 Tax=Trypanosoma brucei TaxID=5691 RepID=A0A1J0R628_9TRYP|nr:variant surface glycoprotein 1125.1008 [Trypanosoma brucei]